jgi:hypothetical protein
MPKFFDTFRSNVAYAFILVGLAWLAVAYTVHSYYILWPALTALVGGGLLWQYPGKRLTRAWTTSAAVLGLLLSGFQAYVSVQFLAGSFSTIASISLAGFAVFALVHVLILYAGSSAAPQPR